MLLYFIKRVKMFHNSYYYSDMLSPREEEVYEKLLEGCSRKQIAVDLGIKTSTVCTHTMVIFGKKQVNSQTELMAQEIIHLRQQLCKSNNSRQNAA